MLKIIELLTPTPGPLWQLVRQAGVEEVDTLLDGGEQMWRWPSPAGSQAWVPSPYQLPPPGERPWEVPALRRLKEGYAEYGLKLSVIEDTPPIDDVRLGGPHRDEQIEWVCTLIKAMGELEIPVLCYNWMAITTWARTDNKVKLRGGALSTGYDDAVMRQVGPLVEPGSIVPEQLWNALEYFLRAVVPVAEQAGVRLAMHPDDPPIEEVRGVPRILGTPEAFDRLISIVDSPSNGITFCQGNFGLMADDLPALIRHFGGLKKIHFAHFRDVYGTPSCFIETFHDEGPTDMYACMRAYHEVGFDGPLRPDHVPALEGETSDSFGYSNLGRLLAVGYIAGLREAAYGRAPTRYRVGDTPEASARPLGV